MLRTEAVATLARVRGDSLSVCTMQPVEPWNALGQADARNFNMVGCMGSAAAVGLGLALARPHDNVIVIDGDGSLLMQLASLVSIAEHSPSNLTHIVFENGVYETSGNQPVPGRHSSSLTQIALASGYRNALTFATLAELDDGIASALALDGPTFVSLTISGPGTLGPDLVVPAVPRKPVQIENMRRALAAQS